ncbi:MAG: phosphoesterase [Clostridium sp.]|uniref:DHH family phosphoesterase n=1 Tax=Clostridium sp. TaxID=1506 RepID=UPI0028FFC104|nr:DHH family phosphoesterase [Clostridium sp.]MDU1584020.1 phosphoesterase [Clostridium sp.]MDU1977204.1 phosphoesterase [Clostridium sp.]MDU1992772.1 phosphoesterase [Clostridium sp.]MDU6046861.1 phosphoesterase [Clostridium sp.]MDU6220840.1 phosphoesterase [Clostridium sp.]
MRKFWESIYCPNYITGYNPFLLRHMNKAIEKLVYAVNNRKKIVIYGVSSVDGICSIASLSLILMYLNADVEYLIYEEKDAKKSIDCNNIKNDIDFLGADLLITLGVDLKSESEVKLCNELDIDLIVLQNKKTVRERSYVYINPNQKGCQYRYKNLSLSALTFKLMQAIAIYYNLKSINKYLDLILIGAHWAKVPLKGENGVIIKEGKKFLINTNNYGLRAVMELNNIVELDDNSIVKIIELITPAGSTVGMVNNARIILELLITNDKDRAEQISKYLYNLKKPEE